MKNILPFLIAVFISGNALGQAYPDCNDLTVESINIDTAGDLLITTRNTCYSCAYDLTGCLYSEMIVVRAVAPFDTLAATNCYCLHWDDPNTNGELQTFILNTNITTLPSVSEIQVRMVGCGCDTIPFSQTLSSVATEIIENNYSIFPNPTKNEINIDNIPKGSTIQITDISGKTVYKIVNTENEQTIINTTEFVNGVYIIRIEHNGTFANEKFIINK
ncbi:MAG: T9SS type A sorting domain-containing protein [Bacteroidia bacterium]|nr:T9SS type A sorting domain-containing protein [Bacteroidia bacterium]